ncbi:hypothetical protein GCM10009111_16460 [Colwellia asteriadis]|uniref:Uncharacterized protein n=1 Tax=Colwellia asteriadis TaxID=517723 RepID=A0ABN1L6H5_9GAMM
MNIKAYIDYFNEIKSLPRDQQFSLLSQARNDVIDNRVINPFTLITFAFPIFFIALLNTATYLLWGYSIVLMVIAVFIALLISRVVTNEVLDTLLLKSLKQVLAKNS